MGVSMPCGRCGECALWRERWGREWCGCRPAPRLFPVPGGLGCADFRERRGEDWPGMLYGNTDTRHHHV